MLSVEDARIFCEGLSRVVKDACGVSKRANELRLNDNRTSFYPQGGRPNVDFTANAGLGFGSLCSFDDGVPRFNAALGWNEARLWKTYVEQKQRVFENISSQLESIKSDVPSIRPVGV